MLGVAFLMNFYCLECGILLSMCLNFCIFVHDKMHTMDTSHDFKKVTSAEWKAKANLDLKGKISAESLSYNVEDSISFSPFLTQDDVALSDPINGPQTLAGIKIIASNVDEANAKAKTMLYNGAQALAFDVDMDTSLHVLFDGIFLEMITVILFCNHPDKMHERVQSYVSDHYFNKMTNVSVINKDQNRFLQYSETFAQRMSKVKKTLAHWPNNQYNVHIVVELKKDFLAQIAELRAIRRLFDVQYGSDKLLTIFTVIHPDSYVSAEEHPLIIANYLLMSAYFGMADTAFGISYDQDEELARLCLNIHHILNEESGLNFVKDPTAGAYIIEKLTGEMLSLAEQ
jgi:hypothetical protein